MAPKRTLKKVLDADQIQIGSRNEELHQQAAGFSGLIFRAAKFHLTRSDKRPSNPIFVILYDFIFFFTKPMRPQFEAMGKPRLCLRKNFKHLYFQEKYSFMLYIHFKLANDVDSTVTLANHESNISGTFNTRLCLDCVSDTKIDNCVFYFPFLYYFPLLY